MGILGSCAEAAQSVERAHAEGRVDSRVDSRNDSCGSVAGSSEAAAAMLCPRGVRSSPATSRGIALRLSGTSSTPRGMANGARARRRDCPARRRRPGHLAGGPDDAKAPATTARSAAAARTSPVGRTSPAGESGPDLRRTPMSPKSFLGPVAFRGGAPSGTRTPNPLIKSQLLCQLS